MKTTKREGVVIYDHTSLPANAIKYAMELATATGPNESFPASNITPPSPFVFKNDGVRAVVGITCLLSMSGSLLIIASYVFYKELRTRVRLILVHLSLMDLGVGLANFIGVAVYFDQYFSKGGAASSEAVLVSCQAQAFVALFCTNSSVLWTIMLAVYLYLLIVHAESTLARYSLYIFGTLCYLLPLMVSVWLLATGRLGYSPYDSSGWCTIIVTSSDGTSVDLLVSVIGYDIWILLTIVIVPILYIAIRIHVRNKYKLLTRTVPKERLKTALQAVDTKFTLIPVIFLWLRIWTMVLTVIYDYAQIPEDDIPQGVSETLIYLSGIGDSAQGAANGILFVLFTRRVRDLVLLVRCCKQHRKDEMDYKPSHVTLPSEYKSRSSSPLLTDSIGACIQNN